jgi:2,3-bisphosphoglycerate-dependent phosphoglycerate mutase
VVRDSFDDPDLRAPGGEPANDVLGRAWPALQRHLSGSSVLPVVVTHGNLLALLLHSIDPSFGYFGWENLSRPDVHRVEVDGDGGMSFRRLWNLSRIR